MEVTPQELSGRHTWDPDEVLPGRLRVLREAAGLTQRQLAHQMTLAGRKMHQTTIAKIEAGERPVSVGEGAALADIMGCGLGDLITEPATLQAAADLAEAFAECARWERRVMEQQAIRDVAAAELADAEDRLTAARDRAHALNLQIRGQTEGRAK